MIRAFDPGVQEVNLEQACTWHIALLCSDGSAVPHSLSELSRAAWAVVAMGEDCEVPLFIVSGPVWRGLPQTSQCSEHMGALMASKLVSPSLPLASDCMSVVNTCAQTVPLQLGYWKMYSGIRRLDLLSAGPGDERSVSHVAAHRTLDVLQGLEGSEKRAAYGNFHADLAAKAAVGRCHRQPPRALDSAVQQQAQRGKTVLRLAAAIMMLHPREKFDRQPRPLVSDAERHGQARKGTSCCRGAGSYKAAHMARASQWCWLVLQQVPDVVAERAGLRANNLRCHGSDSNHAEVAASLADEAQDAGDQRRERGHGKGRYHFLRHLRGICNQEASAVAAAMQRPAQQELLRQDCLDPNPGRAASHRDGSEAWQYITQCSDLGKGASSNMEGAAPTAFWEEQAWSRDAGRRAFCASCVYRCHASAVRRD